MVMVMLYVFASNGYLALLLAPLPWLLVVGPITVTSMLSRGVGWGWGPLEGPVEGPNDAAVGNTPWTLVFSVVCMYCYLSVFLNASSGQPQSMGHGVL